jgi:hypothetical protein
MPVSKYYKPLSGNVRVPGEEDPVEIGRQGNTTSMDFGFGPEANIEAAQQYGRAMGSRRPVTQSEISEDALMRSQLGVPDIPLDLLQFGRGMPQMPAPLAGKPAKPAESYGTNRGGTGSAGRGQLGKSQFDVQTYAQPEMSIADLRKMDDKPWELDDNTAADVTPGLSFTQKPEENVVDKEPDLQSPRGMYEALAKRYPDILTQNLDQLQKSRVTEEDLEGLSDRSGLGSLFIAASKAASGAGSIGGKTAESIAPAIVNREDTLARQRLKDRMDVASENMQMNAKAVDLAIKQINFADEREQYDPNSDVSQFARDFMKQEFDVNVPANVPAYQLKQFMPAVVQKYQAEERARYQGALLGQRTEESLINDAYRRYQTATQSGDKQAQIEAQKEIARLRAMQKAQPQAPKPEKPTKMLGDVPADVAKIEMDLAKQFRADKTVQAHQLMQNELRQLEGLVAQGSSYSDQALITKFSKILDPGSVVRETEFAITERGGGLIKSIENYASKVAGGGRLQPSQRQEMIDAARALANGVAENYTKKRKEYADQGGLYGARPEAIIGVESTPSAGAKPSEQTKGKSGLTSEQRKKRIEQLKAAEGGN